MATENFQGWMGLDPSASQGKMVWQEFTPKTWEETDVDIKVICCGICGSDMHTLRSGWGPSIYPCCVGHEIIGTVVRVGNQAEGNLQIGDRVGVGAQNESCAGRNAAGTCDECSTGRENYCPNHFTGTYSSKYLNGGISYGGYSTYHRVPARFAIKIPEAIPSTDAAPMLCAGVTTYAPLKANGCGPGKTVGVIGVGGLGHFAIMFAKAMGADRVVGISRKSNKKDDALALGADDYIATGEDDQWATKNARSLDILVCTVSSSKMPIVEYASLLRTSGSFLQLGIPDDGTLEIPAVSLILKGIKLSGSLVGSPSEIREMLDLVAEKGIKPWVQERPMKDANQAIVDMEDGKARYRYVLVNEQ